MDANVFAVESRSGTPFSDSHILHSMINSAQDLVNIAQSDNSNSDQGTPHASQYPECPTCSLVKKEKKRKNKTLKNIRKILGRTKNGKTTGQTESHCQCKSGSST